MTASTTTPRNERRSIAHRPPILIVLGLTALVVAAGCSSAMGAGAPSSAPSTPPSVAPSVAPSVPASVPPTVEPSDGGEDAMPLTIVLDNATDADVYVDIVDRTGGLTGAVSGTPGDGASVAPYTLQVTNLDARTLRLTWSDYPIDNALALYLDPTASGLRIVLVQPEPTGPTDAMAFDRVLDLAFDAPVSAADVEAFLQDGLDTAG